MNHDDDDYEAAMALSLASFDEEQEIARLIEETRLSTSTHDAVSNTYFDDDDSLELAKQLSMMGVSENRCKHRHCSYAFEGFVNTQNYCWLHSITQALARVMEYTPQQAVVLKTDILESLPDDFKLGRQEDASLALLYLLMMNPIYEDVFKARKPTFQGRYCLQSGDYETSQVDDIAFTTYSKSFEDMFVDNVEVNDVSDCPGGNAMKTTYRFPGRAALIQNPSSVPVNEVRRVINPFESEAYNLVAVVRHSNPNFRAAGHYFVDIVTKNSVYRIDDTKTEVEKVELSKEATNGVIYFFVKQ